MNWPGAEWKCVLEIGMVQYVMNCGITRLHLWCVDNWDSLLMVRLILNDKKYYFIYAGIVQWGISMHPQKCCTCPSIQLQMGCFSKKHKAGANEKYTIDRFGVPSCIRNPRLFSCTDFIKNTMTDNRCIQTVTFSLCRLCW